MNQITQEFIDYFNQLEAFLDTKSANFNYSAYLNKLIELRDTNPLIANYFHDLQHLGTLRNVLVHNHKEYALPSPWSLNLLKQIVTIINKPPTAWDMATREKLYTCIPESPIKEVVAQMAKHTYTHVPVYNQIGEFVGVFSESTLVQWLGKTEEWIDKDIINKAVVSEKSLIQDLIEFVKKPINDSWLFLPRTATVFEVEKAFEDSLKIPYDRTFKRLGLILVTQSGNPNEKLLGLITAWDLPRIKTLLS